MLVNFWKQLSYSCSYVASKVAKLQLQFLVSSFFLQINFWAKNTEIANVFLFFFRTESILNVAKIHLKCLKNGRTKFHATWITSRLHRRRPTKLSIKYFRLVSSILSTSPSQDGVVVRASASQSVDLGFIPLVESYQKTLKNGIHSFPAWRSALRGGYGEEAGKFACCVLRQGT